MALGASRSEGSGGENVTHFSAVRLRVTGSGSLLMSLESLDNIRSVTIQPISMAPLTNIQPTKLTNFLEQRAIFRFSTTNKDEYFRISRIVIFAKELFTSYPN